MVAVVGAFREKGRLTNGQIQDERGHPKDTVGAL